MIQKFLLLIIAILILGGVGYVLAWMRIRAKEQRLRDNPPVLARMVVRLPPEAERSNEKMTRFFSRLERLLPNDDEAVEQNTNILHAALIGTGRAEGQSPKVQYVIWCNPELMERVELELMDAYGGQAQILALKEEDDPFLGYVKDVRALQAWEEAQRQAEAEAKAEEERRLGQQDQ